MLKDVIISNKSYAKLEVPKEYVLDTIALKVIRQDCPEFLLPVKTMEIDGSLEIRYELQDGVRMSYLPKQMKKQDFKDLLIRMLLPFKTCSDWFLDYHNILLDENYILIGKNQQSVKYVYLPLPAYAKTDEEIKSYFSNLILTADVKDDGNYMVRLLRVISSPDSSLLTLLDFLQKEPSAPVTREVPKEMNQEIQEQVKIEEPVREEPEPVQEPKGFRFSDLGFGKKDAKPEKEEVVIPEAQRPGMDSPVFGKNDEGGRLLGSLFGDASEEEAEKEDKKKKKEKTSKSGGLFGFLKGKNKEEKAEENIFDGLGSFSSNQASSNQMFQSSIHESRANRPEVKSGTPSNEAYQQFVPAFSDTESEMTSVEGVYETNENMLQLFLESCAGCTCPQYIDINMSRGFATVGRANKNGEAQADYNFDASISFVSRRHFRVEKAGEGWKIIDLESSNGTILNGETLVPNVPYTMKRGDKIMVYCNKRQFTYRVC